MAYAGKQEGKPLREAAAVRSHGGFMASSADSISFPLKRVVWLRSLTECFDYPLKRVVWLPSLADFLDYLLKRVTSLFCFAYCRGFQPDCVVITLQLKAPKVVIHQIFLPEGKPE